MNFNLIFVVMNVYIFSAEAKSHGLFKGIRGGDEAVIDDFKYQVSLTVIGDVDDEDHFLNECGGGIIGEQHILTAAHCFIENDGSLVRHRYKVVFATSHLRKMDDNSFSIPAGIFFIPKEYKATSKCSTYADIAVLKLNRPIGLLNHPELMQLSLPQDVSETFDNMEALLAGYGCDTIEEGNENWEEDSKSSGQLRYAKVRIMSLNECNSKRKTPLNSAHMCARVEQRDPNKPEGICDGDSGSPLVYRNTVVGVVSAGPKHCSEVRLPSIYNRVTYWKSFINDAMEMKNLEDMRIGTYIKKRNSRGIYRVHVREITDCNT